MSPATSPTAAIFIALIGITYRPVRIIPAAVVLALIAVGMGTRSRALGIAAVAVDGRVVRGRDDGRRPDRPPALVAVGCRGSRTFAC